MRSFRSTFSSFSVMFGSVFALMFLCMSVVARAQTSPPAAPPVAPPSGLNPKLPTLFVVGDSTARNNANGAQGWGDPFASYFDPAKINVANRAMAGRSSRTFIAEGRWDRVLAEMKAGDFMLLQMGHNDGGPVDTGKARASLPGLGEETQEVTKADGSKEVVHTYGWYMRKFIADTKAKGATPIVLSLTVRNIWKDGKVERGSGRYGQMSAEIAKSQGVQFVDVTNIIADQYQALGEEKTKAMFGPDYVHTSPQGADLNAASVVAGLKTLANTPLVNLLSEKGKAVAPYVAAPAGGVIPVASPANAPNTTVPANTQTAPVTPAPQTRRPLPVPADPALPTLFLIGDSTVRNGQGDGSNGQWGWGEPIAAYFDQNKINVVNRAVGGLSSRTYLTGGFWNDTLAMIKPGDFVIMQFGHNDSGAINDASRARATIRGVGDETEEIDNMLTKKHEVVHTYGWYLKKYIADARAKGATPMVCSPIPRKGFGPNGKANRNAGTYGGWAAQVAASEGVAFINLNEIIAKQYDALGAEKVEPLFADANTHTSLVGAEINAASVVAGLKALQPSPLAAYFSVKAAPVAPARGEVANSALATAMATKVSMRFDFSGKAAPGSRAVTPDMVYSKERGYGFEPGFPVKAENGAPISDKPFFFSVALPEGNYSVTMILGDQTREATTTVKAELRRLVLERVHTAPGQFVRRTFTVNTRTPQISTGGEVRLKPREKTSEIWNWDDKLTFEFNGTRPALRSLEIRRADSAVTVFLMGDSTVCDQPGEPYNSWGQMLPRFFKEGVAVANHAQSGESLRSSLGAKRLDKVQSLLKPGDYVLIQFGHNDMKEKGEGIGAFTSYKTDLKHFVDVVRQKGGIPVIVTSVSRRSFDPNGKITNTFGDYIAAQRQLAQEEKLALIDLNAMSIPFYEALGPEKSKLAFAPGDNTHHNNYGSYELAKCIVEGVKANKLGLAVFLADDVPAFDPSRPDAVETFAIPASPSMEPAKPDGS